MRVLSAAAIILSVAVFLSGCGKIVSTPYDISDVEALLETGVFSGDMFTVDSAALISLYGLDPDSVLACAGSLAANTAVSAGEVTVFVVKDEASAIKAEEACRMRVESLLENARSYSPAAVPSLEAAVIDRVGNTVLLAVGDPERLPDAVGGIH